MAFLEVRNITKKFDKQIVLDNISAEIQEGELVCILGPSGCGKTTLLRIIAGLETTDRGKIFIDNKDATYFPPAKRNFGIVFQSYALFPNMTVLGNILFGLKEKKDLSKEAMQEAAHDALRLVDLLEHKDKYPLQLSGGMQQRTALARAIVLSPKFLLLDEPLSALDAKVRQKLRGEIRYIQKNLGITTVMVTHDQEEALTMADRIIVMNKAVVEQIGTPREIYEKPETPFVADFIGMMNFYEKAGVTYAIRPENIEVCKKTENHDYQAVIKTFEFRGPITRIHTYMPDESELCLDINSETVNEMHLSDGGNIYVRLPHEYIIKYDNKAE